MILCRILLYHKITHKRIKLDEVLFRNKNSVIQGFEECVCV